MAYNSGYTATLRSAQMFSFTSRFVSPQLSYEFGLALLLPKKGLRVLKCVLSKGRHHGERDSKL